MTAHKKRNEAVQEARVQYDQSMLQETLSPIYRFGEGVLFGEDLTLSESAISIPGFAMPVSLDLENPYSDMV